MIHILITFSNRCRKIAKPASYQDLIAKARKEFPMMSSVACLVVMFYPKTTDEIVPGVKMVELDSNAYGSVKDGEILFFNVQHPITKEYILPYPDEDPDIPRQSQYHPADIERMFERSDKNKHVKVSSTQFLERCPIYEDTNAFSPENQRVGGDAFGSGWGAASGRCRRSNKLVPKLKECRDAAGLSIGASNEYSSDHSADDQNKFVGAAAELQGAFDALTARLSAQAPSGRCSDGVWSGSDASRQRGQQTENVVAAEVGWGNSGTGAATPTWGYMSAADRCARPASPKMVDMFAENTLSSAEPSWPTARRAGASTDNNDDLQRFRAAQPNEYVGDNTDKIHSGPAYHRTSALSERSQQFNYSLPNAQSFEKLVAPAANGPTHLAPPLELRERKATFQQTSQACQNHRLVRDPDPISKYQSPVCNPARSTRGSPVRKQPSAQGNASSQWATKEALPKANSRHANIWTGDIQEEC
ncbi:hypothetical protein N0V93_010235 [Gnomoniopsis smithogilvyi]|uniref:Uncharacterized protein n=1 Tax=Gnomoniopsis smithogilvyi TaxID=1191159 RepID=A0A9W8YJA9_9PEZI|nr:hypothetical protein N0V93_010235 [Gnomoniopsis smithogilvyi]